MEVILSVILCLGFASFSYARNETLINDYEKINGVQSELFRSQLKDSRFITQGNPNVTEHPVTKSQCLNMLKQKKIEYRNAKFEKICGSPYMAPLYNPQTEKMEDAKLCIDQFEFPNIPCDYPVVWVRANEAAAICEAAGKRLCDAHEWEGACDGAFIRA